MSACHYTSINAFQNGISDCNNNNNITTRDYGGFSIIILPCRWCRVVVDYYRWEHHHIIIIIILFYTYLRIDARSTNRTHRIFFFFYLFDKRDEYNIIIILMQITKPHACRFKRTRQTSLSYLVWRARKTRSRLIAARSWPFKHRRIILEYLRNLLNCWTNWKKNHYNVM